MSEEFKNEKIGNPVKFYEKEAKIYKQKRKLPGLFF